MTGPPTGAAAEAGADFVVVGAGIVGLAVARELTLRHPGAEIVVLERESRIAAHQSGRSSGIIHAGVYYRPGSLKAGLCVEGASRLYTYCAERSIAARPVGKLIVATREPELDRLAELHRRGTENGVPGLRMLESSEIAEVEPHVRGIAALHSPRTGIVDFGAVAAALAADAREAGATIALGCPVTELRETVTGLRISHGGGTLTARRAVICAGPWADRMARAAGAPAEPRIVPFRGAYLRLRDGRKHLVRGNVYPVPDPALPFLGAHLSPTVSGEVLFGPTALFSGSREGRHALAVRPRDLAESLLWPGTWRLFARHARSGARELRNALLPGSLAREARRLVPELRRADLVRSPYAGVRAQAVALDGTLVDDFLITAGEHSIHVRNAPSPAATAALPLAEEIAGRLERLG